MTIHTCPTCTASKSRRKLVALLRQQPNMTTLDAAAKVDVTRPYAAELRREMLEAGCIPARERSGNAQGYIKRALTAAKTTGGHPIAHTMPGDVAEMLSHFRAPPRPIGTLWTPLPAWRAA